MFNSTLIFLTCVKILLKEFILEWLLTFVKLINGLVAWEIVISKYWVVNQTLSGGKLINNISASRPTWTQHRFLGTHYQHITQQIHFLIFERKCKFDSHKKYK